MSRTLGACLGCEFWAALASDGQRGTCSRYPASVRRGPGDPPDDLEGSEFRHPIMWMGDGCGEWEAAS